MEIEATLIVKKILQVEGPKDVETAVGLIRSMITGGHVEVSTFQKWNPGSAKANPSPCEELLHIVDLRPYKGG